MYFTIQYLKKYIYIKKENHNNFTDAQYYDLIFIEFISQKKKIHRIHMDLQLQGKVVGFFWLVFT